MYSELWCVISNQGSPDPLVLVIQYIGQYIGTLSKYICTFGIPSGTCPLMMSLFSTDTRLISLPGSQRSGISILDREYQIIQKNLSISHPYISPRMQRLLYNARKICIIVVKRLSRLGSHKSKIVKTGIS